ERIVHVRVRVGRWADDTHLGERGDAPAHAVELAHVRIGRADDGEEDRIPLFARGEVASMEDHRLGRSSAHEYGRQFLLWHGVSLRHQPVQLPRNSLTNTSFQVSGLALSRPTRCMNLA